MTQDTRELVTTLKMLAALPTSHRSNDEIDGTMTQAADTITTLSERVRVLEADKARLDFLDECNSALNARSGTVYGWAMVMNHNVNRLMTERHHLAVDLHDSKAHGAKSCRIAIDNEMRRIAAARAALAGGQG